MKLEVKPPSSTTISLGRPVQSRRRPVGERGLGDRRRRVERIGKAGAHHAGERGDEDALGEVELLDRRLLLLLGHLAFLGHARPARDGDPDETDEDAEQDDLAGRRPEDLAHELAVEDRRHQRAEGGAVAEGHRHAERHPEVAHREAEGQPAQAPHGAPEPGPPERRGGGLAQHRQQVPRVDRGEDPGSDDPAEEAADQPVDLPGPLLHAPVRDVEAAGGEAAEPVEEDAEERVRLHDVASLRAGARTALDVEDLAQLPRDGAVVGVRRHQVAHVPPPPSGRRRSKRRPPSAPRCRSRRRRRARSSRDRDRSSSSARRASRSVSSSSRQIGLCRRAYSSCWSSCTDILKALRITVVFLSLSRSQAQAALRASISR